jgi:hypothetical protein
VSSTVVSTLRRARGLGLSSSVPHDALISGSSGGLYHALAWYAMSAPIVAVRPSIATRNGLRRIANA